MLAVVGAHLRGPGTIEIGYWIGGAARGRGYGTEAVAGVLVALRQRFPKRGVLAECLGQVPTLVMTLRGSPLVASLISLAVLVVTLPAVWLAARTDNLEIVMAASVVPLALAVPVQLHFSERAEPSGVKAENLRIWALMVLAAGVGAVVFAVLGRVLPDVLSIAVCAVALGLAWRLRRALVWEGWAMW